MTSIRYVDPVPRVLDTFRLNIGEFLEERRNVENHGGTNQIDAIGDNKTGWEEVEVIGDAIGPDRVAAIVAPL
jgi:hypothetical protein